jgi:hypothetical protein
MLPFSISRIVVYTLILYFSLISIELLGQKTFQPKSIEYNWKGIVYRQEYTGRAAMHTNGYSLAYDRGQIKTYYRTTYYHFELGYMTDPREHKQNRSIPRTFNKVSESFKFGKQNYMYVLRASKGVKRLLSGKTKHRGVALGYNYNVGPSLAILRPYYLELEYKVERDDKIYYELRPEKYSEENADKFLDYNSVFGRATGGKGWSEISIVPGIQGKFGLFFSLGAFDEYAKGLEIGIMGDLYIRKIPLMVQTEAISNKPYFLNFYIAVELGKRKY